jgi:V/A-type H+-transporting ATPase subunit C
MYFSSNAVLIKARSLYSKGLNTKDYKKLISCENVSQLTQTLKQLKPRSCVIDYISEKEVHRAILESALREELFDEFDVLAKYDSTLGEKLFEYIVTKLEVAQLSRFLTFLFAGITKDYVFFPSEFLKRHTSINFENLKKIKSPIEFQKVLDKFIGAKKSKNYVQEKTLDINTIETMLYTHLFEKVFEIASHLDKKSRLEVEMFYKEYIDFSNFYRIFRLSKFYNVKPEQSKEFLFPFGNISTRKLVSLSWKTIFEKSRILKRFDQKKISNFDLIPKLIKYRWAWAKQKIRYSMSPSLATISYIFLKEIEILNIVNIIEGIRYDLGEKKICSMIIN